MIQMGESNNHKVESFFLDNFSIDRLFDRIERTDYVFLYYIRYCEEQNQSNRVYLANLAQVMNIKMPQLSKGIETLQNKGYVAWKTDHELGKTYVEITPRASELMVRIRQRMEECYARIKEEIGEEEMERTAQTMRRVSEIVRDSTRAAE